MISILPTTERVCGVVVVSIGALIFVCLARASVRAQKLNDGRTRAVVIALDESSETQKLEDATRRLLTQSGQSLVAKSDLERRISRHWVNRDALPSDSSISARIEKLKKGIKAFYYEGDTAAIDKLQPLVRAGFENPVDLSVSRAYADKLYEAASIVIRAHRNLGREVKQKKMASRLLRHLPALDPAKSSIPPPIRHVIRGALERLREHETTIEVRRTGLEDCDIRLNGFPFERTSYAIYPGLSYALSVQCPGQPLSVWRLDGVGSGQTVRVPLASQKPGIRPEMVAQDIKSARIERQLELFLFWGHLDKVVGLVRHRGSKRLRFQVVAVRRRAPTVWSEPIARSRVDAVIDRYHSDRDIEVKPGSPDAALFREQGTNWSDAPLLISSGIFAGLGIAGAITARRRVRRVECSPDYPGARSASECEGVKVVRFTSGSEADSAHRWARTVEVSSYTALGIGIAGIATWGVLRWSESRGDSKRATDLGIGVSNKAVRARVVFRF